MYPYTVERRISQYTPVAKCHRYGILWQIYDISYICVKTLNSIGGFLGLGVQNFALLPRILGAKFPPFGLWISRPRDISQSLVNVFPNTSLLSDLCCRSIFLYQLVPWKCIHPIYYYIFWYPGDLLRTHSKYRDTLLSQEGHLRKCPGSGCNRWNMVNKIHIYA